MAELTVEVFEEKMDSFAKIVKEGFDAVDERFNSVDERLDVMASVTQTQFAEVNEKLERMDKRIDGLYTLIDSFITLHQKLDIELTALRDKYNHLSKAHNGLANEHRDLVARVTRLEGAPA